jgi:RNA-directed DNA polymerase
VRGAEGALRRRRGNGVHVGGRDGEARSAPEVGTPQGAVRSLLVGNVYVPDGLDRWLETEVTPRLQGRAPLMRFGDDVLLGCEQEADARRVPAVLGNRWGRFGRALHPDKPRRLPCGQPPQAQQHGNGPATLDVVGFTCYGRRTRQGHGRRWCKTRRASFRRAKTSIDDWCRRHRQLAIEAQHAALSRRWRGHCNDFGVSGTCRRVLRLVEATQRAWDKWRCRRSQRKRRNGERFSALLRQFPLPRPRIMVQIWGV